MEKPSRPSNRAHVHDGVTGSVGGKIEGGAGFGIIAKVGQPFQKSIEQWEKNIIGPFVGAIDKGQGLVSKGADS